MAGLKSPGINRLDRILELVTEHESTSRQQDLRLADLAQRVAETEMRMGSQLQAVQMLKDRDVTRELDMARTAIEALVRQFSTLSRGHQSTQADVKRCLSQTSSSSRLEQQLAALTSEVSQLSARLDALQDNTAEAVEQLKVSAKLQLEAHKAAMQQQLEEGLQQLRRDLREAAAAEANSQLGRLQDVDARLRGEMLALTANLKTVVSTCSSHQEQMNLQMEALQQQWENTTKQMEGVNADTRKMKRSVTRIQNAQEEVAQLGQQALAAELALQHVNQELQQLKADNQQLAGRLELLVSQSSSMGREVRATQQQLDSLEGAVSTTGKELSHLAETMGGCLTAVHQEVASSSGSSYLSALLAPVTPNSGAAAAAAGGAFGPGRPQAAQWDQKMAEFDDLVLRLKRRLRDGHTQQQLRSLTHGSPRR